VMSAQPEAALYMNSSGRFECIPTLLKHENRGSCLFTSLLPKGKVLLVPCAHAEGKLMFEREKEQKLVEELEKNDQVVFRYVDSNGNYAGYPWCPNGAVSNIAGICNKQGNVLGLMPHPERVFHRYQHPDWTRSSVDPSSDGDGKPVFVAAVQHVLKSKK